MKTIVFVKEVPETPDGVKVSEHGQIAADAGGSFLTDPIDPYSVEAALKIRESQGGEVVVMSSGASRSEKILKEALAMGADNAVLLTGDGLDGADPTATARALAAAARKSGDFDLIVVGERAADDNAGIVGPVLGRLLDIPIITYVSEIQEVDGEAKKIRAVRTLEKGKEVVEASLPAVVTVIKGINEPRYPSLLGIRKASKREVPSWGAGDLGEDASRFGAAGSPTMLRSLDPPPPPSGVEMIEGEPDEAAAELVKKIMDRKIL
jgi:electron transfer flavoprotein beta subunit